MTGTDMQANYISAKELEAELLKVNFDNAKRGNGAAATDDLLQQLRKTHRVAKSLRTKKSIILTKYGRRTLRLLITHISISLRACLTRARWSNIH